AVVQPRSAITRQTFFMVPIRQVSNPARSTPAPEPDVPGTSTDQLPRSTTGSGTAVARNATNAEPFIVVGNECAVGRCGRAGGRGRAARRGGAGCCAPPPVRATFPLLP